MFNKVETVEDVKKKLKVEDFDNLTPRQETKLKKMLPKLNEKVVMQIMQQLPNYIDFARSIVTQMNESCQAMLKESGNARTDAVNGYMLILQGLEKQLQKETLSRKEKKEITDDMMEVARCISNEGDKQRDFMKNILSKAVTVGGVVFGAVTAVIIAILTGKPTGKNS